jgi:hypothetical protein
MKLVLAMLLLALGTTAARADSVDDMITVARNLASDGQCDAMRDFAQRVQAADPVRYTQVLAVDPAIAGCDLGVAALPAMPERLSPNTALGLSLGVTLGGGAAIALGAGAAAKQVDGPAAMLIFLGVAGVVIGPTFGHMYAHDTWNRGLEVRLGGVGLSALGALAALPCIARCTNGQADAGVILFLGGAAMYAGGTLYEIGSAYGAAETYNSGLGHPQLTLAPIVTPRGDAAPGIGLVGRF